MSLQNIPIIDQKSLYSYYRLAIRKGKNCLALGPSGTGKTEIAYQAAAAEGVEVVYWNLSVTERPDIQGIPRPSSDGLVAKYAAPERLPFADVRARIIRNALKHFSNGYSNMVGPHLRELLEQLEAAEAAEELRQVIRHVSHEEARKQIKERILQLEAKIKDLGINNVMILFDEIDKAPSEVLQPLLELLLSRRINDRPLCINGCILTGNLPDEHAHSEPLSHPVAIRNMIFQLEPNFDVWVNWALQNRVNSLYTGFLSWTENRELFHKRPANHEIHTYAFPNPRGWTQASRLTDDLEEHQDLLEGLNFERFKQDLIASKVGVEAANKLAIWDKYYQELGPVITEAYDGKSPDIFKMEADKQLVCLIGASARFVAFAREEDNLDAVHDKARAVYGWMRKANPDFQVAALRGTCDADLFAKKGLVELKGVSEIWWEIVQATEDQREEETDGTEAAGSVQPSAA